MATNKPDITIPSFRVNPEMLREARIRCNLSQLEVMRRTGIANCTLSIWERDTLELYGFKLYPSMFQLAALCRLYGVSSFWDLCPEPENAAKISADFQLLSDLTEPTK